jgi:D-glycero-D-manno-heptose 1,7-bisphosphate phosphatase
MVGVYLCPHHPEGLVPGMNIECGCRKPQPGMIKRAAAELDVDLSASYLVGGKISDIQAGMASLLKESFLIDIAPHGLAKNFPSLFDTVKFALTSN